jgi:hypothetical protein
MKLFLEDRSDYRSDRTRDVVDRAAHVEYRLCRARHLQTRGRRTQRFLSEAVVSLRRMRHEFFSM